MQENHEFYEGSFTVYANPIISLVLFCILLLVSGNSVLLKY